MTEINYRYTEQQCNIYGCDYGGNPDPDDTCMYCGSDQKKGGAEQ
jgi:hypothetical protein